MSRRKPINPVPWEARVRLHEGVLSSRLKHVPGTAQDAQPPLSPIWSQSSQQLILRKARHGTCCTARGTVRQHPCAPHANGDFRLGTGLDVPATLTAGNAPMSARRFEHQTDVRIQFSSWALHAMNHYCLPSFQVDEVAISPASQIRGTLQSI